MKLLVDTHIFLWIIFSPKKISKRVRELLLNPQMSIFLSVISFWEISLKYQLGKLELRGILPDQLPAIAKDTRFKILNLDIETVVSFYKLPKQGNLDPFDRMLAWQAIHHNYYLLSKDQNFASYKSHGLKVVW